MSIREPRVSNQFIQISVELSYATKLLYVPPGLRSHSVETNSFVLKCEHLLMVCAMLMPSPGLSSEN